MPRPTKPERLQNPLRQLRIELAEPGKLSISQADLSDIVDVPLDSLKGVESGRKTFTDAMRKRILCEIGAEWNEQDKRWRFWKPDGPLYTREHFLRYRQILENQQHLWLDHEAFFAHLRIKFLLESLPPKERFKFYFRLNTFLDTARKEFGANSDTVMEFFDDASGFVMARPEFDRFNVMVMERGYPQRLLDHVKVDIEEWFNQETFDLSAYRKALKRHPKPAKAAERI